MRIAIIIASLGRSETLTQLMKTLGAQTRAADRIVICVTTPADGPDPDAAAAVGADVIVADRRGSCAQRNVAVDRVGADADILLFMDDDFVPATDYIEETAALFAARPDLAGVTGRVLADGATGPGLDVKAALEILARAENSRETLAETSTETPVGSLYGCNMAVRREAVAGAAFDERLPLYGWLEDVDYSAYAAKSGPLLRSERLRGVHLGVKRGRTSGVRFGYSQVVNPLYLLGKQTISRKQAYANLFRTVIANHTRAAIPESYVDRRGRVWGNWLAFMDVVRGRARPERILELE